MSSTKKHKYSSKASSLAYASLNILLALAVFGTIYVTNSDFVGKAAFLGG